MKNKILKLQKQKKYLKNLAAMLAFTTTLSGCAIENAKTSSEKNNLNQLIKEIFGAEIDLKNLNHHEEPETPDLKGNVDFSIANEIANKLKIDLNNKEKEETISKKSEPVLISNLNNSQEISTNEEIYGEIMIPPIKEFHASNNETLGNEIPPERKHTHNYIWQIDSAYEKGECECGDVIIQDHVFSDWKYNINNQDIRNCLNCGYEEIKNHEHDINLDGVSYICTKSNHDGTHELEASSSCSTCGEIITETKIENCNPTITIEPIEPSNFAITNTHYVKSYCEACKDESILEQACTPIGELQYIKYLSQTYEYQICSECQNRCNQQPHYTHYYGDWTFYDERQHRKECGCGSSFDPVVEDRYLYESHDISSSTRMVCSTCGYTKEEAMGHDHATDNMDLIDLVLSPFYGDLIDTNQIANPNPSADSYCFRYDLRCSTCGIYYSVKQPHHFENGYCVGGYCNHIADPNYGITSTSEETNQKVYTLTN